MGLAMPGLIGTSTVSPLEGGAAAPPAPDGAGAGAGAPAPGWAGAAPAGDKAGAAAPAGADADPAAAPLISLWASSPGWVLRPPAISAIPAMPANAANAVARKILAQPQKPRPLVWLSCWSAMMKGRARKHRAVAGQCPSLMLPAYVHFELHHALSPCTSSRHSRAASNCCGA